VSDDIKTTPAQPVEVSDNEYWYARLDATFGAEGVAVIMDMSKHDLSRLAEAAAARSQSPAETLSAALDALASAPSAAQAARLATLAGTRRQMLADCIRWLEEWPTSKTKKLEAAVVVPEAARPMHPDGQPYCRCDGPEEPGPWHRCHRRTVG